MGEEELAVEAHEMILGKTASEGFSLTAPVELIDLFCAPLPGGGGLLISGSKFGLCALLPANSDVPFMNCFSFHAVMMIATRSAHAFRAADQQDDLLSVLVHVTM